MDRLWLAYTSIGTQTAVDVEESNPTKALNKNKSNSNYPTIFSVAQKVENGAIASGYDTENVSETSSAKQRREEGMKNFDFEFKTKLRLKQARFERRKLELEMQTKKLKSMHQLLEKQRELERKVKRSSL